MKTEQRIDDEKKEKIIHEFLVKHYYSLKYELAEEVNDSEEQKRGVDEKVKIGEELLLCDEKAGSPNASGNLFTGCFELQTSVLDINKKPILGIDNNPKRYDGWFVNENSVTDFYVYCFVDEKGIKTGEYTIEVLFLKKQKVVEYFQKHGWSQSQLVKKANIIWKAYLKDGENGLKDINFGTLKDNGFKFSFTYNNPERNENPINAIIPRSELRKLAKDIWIDNGEFQEFLKTKSSDSIKSWLKNYK